MTVATAPGKIILFGEHAVVYGRPAIAVPVLDVQARVTIENGPPGQGCMLIAPDIDEVFRLGDTAADQPLAFCLRLALDALGISAEPDWQIVIESSIPVAGGMGSGAAVSTALVRAVYAHLGESPDADAVNRLVYQVEKLHHGTPSGIDNTVIAYEKPVWFQRGQPPLVFDVARPFRLVIADTGIPSPTGQAVADVRRAWQAETKRYDSIFDRIGAVVEAARNAIRVGGTTHLGPLVQENQRLLRQIHVSSPELEHLIEIAEEAGAAGAKLSGGGRGGNLIALVSPAQARTVLDALVAAGAARALLTVVGGDSAQSPGIP